MVKILANIRFEKGRLGLSPVKESFQCDPPGDQCYLHVYIYRANFRLSIFNQFLKINLEI